MQLDLGTFQHMNRILSDAGMVESGIRELRLSWDADGE